ncbi:hypothetical protein NKR23_g10373 [Pleurostoma richardsiae]|uniref:BTB domain-containing protein n=1 Tax=Pleurostoma richardsiae TaxID=41990 RepID=A0AA38VIL9_9PEZI|nr:hypothetical protein NKR23_g10373 [Pleurostoma richardsiae]
MDHLATSMIHAALWPLYASGKMSDLASPFFDKACNSGFKEGIENIIDLPEEDPDTVDRFFQFLYAGNYSDGEYFYLLPSVAATMTPGAVSESLQKVSKPDNGEAPVFKTLGVSATVSSVNIEKDHPQENSEEDDKDYTSDAVDEEDEDPLEYDSEASKCTDPDDLYDSDLLYDEELNKDKLPPYITEYSTEHPISTFTSLRVYLMADKYDVPALKLLAKDRFIRTIESTWLAYDDFPAVIDELFELTIPDDPLRNFVCELIVFVSSESSDNPFPN